MNTQTIERTTLSNLVSNENYCRKVLPFIKADYFDVKEERIVFEEIHNFVDKYKKVPTKISLEIEVEGRKDLTEIEHSKIVEIRKELPMQFQIYYEMHWLFLLTMLLVTIILQIQILGSTTITESKNVCLLI